MITYRSYRKFDDDIFKRDIAHAPFHVAEIFDDLDDKFWFYETLSNELLNSHAPLKKRKPKPNPVPFMNSKYRKACHSKAMAHNKFLSGAAQILYGKYSVSAGTRPPKLGQSLWKHTLMKNVIININRILSTIGMPSTLSSLTKPGAPLNVILLKLEMIL